MSIYSYRGRNASGKRCNGWTEAGTKKEARTLLAARGIMAETVDESAQTVRNNGGRSRRAFCRAARAHFYNGLAALLGAGFTLDQAIGLIISESSQTDGTFLVVRDLIRNGSSLSAAMIVATADLPAFERVALETAENTGLQSQMLMTLAEFLESEAEISDRIRAALTYPAAVLVMATGLLSLMLCVILPKAIATFGKFEGGAPQSAIALATWGPRLMAFFFICAVAITVTVIRINAKAKTDIHAAEELERLSLRIPIAKRLRPTLWAMRFSNTMSLLIGAGVAPQSAISVSGASSGSAWLTALSAKAADDVKNGLPLSEAIGHLTPIAPLLAEWIRIGESSGSLSHMLSQASERFRKSYENTLTRALGLLEPSLIVFVGLIVLFIAFTVLRPMLAISSAVGL